MKPPLVIGYGNPLRQDDGLGWRAAEMLERAIPPSLVTILQAHQLTPELAVDLDGAPLVIFLDAAVDLKPGMVVAKSVSPANESVWSHDLSPEQLTGLTDLLTGTVRPSFQITGGVFQTGLGESVTPAGEQCAARMAEAAIKLLAPATRLHTGSV